MTFCVFFFFFFFLPPQVPSKNGSTLKGKNETTPKGIVQKALIKPADVRVHLKFRSLVFLAHLSRRLRMSYCDHSPSVRPSVRRPYTLKQLL